MNEATDPDVRSALLALCNDKAARDEAGTFALGCREAAAAVGVHPVAASRQIASLVADGLLVMADPGRGCQPARYRLSK